MATKKYLGADGIPKLKELIEENFVGKEQGSENAGKVLGIDVDGNVIPVNGGGTAADTTYDNSDSGLTADNVQDALDEINNKIPTGDLADLDEVAEDNLASALKTKINGKQDELSFDGAYNPSTNKVATESTVTESLNVNFAQLKQLHDASGAGLHNSIYRGRYLGNTYTAAQSAAISNGTFDDLWIGDYWTIGGVNYRIAAFDYYLHCGDTELTTHHAVIVPDTVLYNYVMNDSNVTTGGYVGSKMYTQGLTQAKTTIKTAFSGHVLNHRVYLVNAVSNGRASAGAWCDSEVDLMNEQMIYGTGILSPVSDGTNVPANYRAEKSQLPLFDLEPGRICNRATWWLRDAITNSAFVYVSPDGCAYFSPASSSRGVHPAFCIY